MICADMENSKKSNEGEETAESLENTKEKVASTLTTFDCFQRLPIELQDMVWTLCLRYRVFRMCLLPDLEQSHQSLPHTRKLILNWTLEKPSQNPNKWLLGVNKHTREFYMSRCIQPFVKVPLADYLSLKNAELADYHAPVEEQLLFLPRTDVLLFDPGVHPARCPSEIRLAISKDLTKIQYIALCVEFYHNQLYSKGVDELKASFNPKRITMILGNCLEDRHNTRSCEVILLPLCETKHLNFDEECVKIRTKEIRSVANACYGAVRINNKALQFP